MGGGGSKTYKTHAEREAERFQREERARVRRETKRLKEERKRIEDREKEVWLKNWRAAEGGGGERKWWPLYTWWKERRAWNAEWARRKGAGYVRVDDVLLKPHQH